MIAEVIVDVMSSEVDRVFDYLVEDDNITVGDRVLLPFGNRTIEGYVLQLVNESDLDQSKLKKIIKFKLLEYIHTLQQKLKILIL